MAWTSEKQVASNKKYAQGKKKIAFYTDDVLAKPFVEYLNSIGKKKGQWIREEVEKVVKNEQKR